jgi:hypothetical protein
MKIKIARRSMGIFLLIAAPLLFIARLTSGADENSSTNWTTIDFRALSFQVPPGMTNVPLQGIDSLVGRCVSSNIDLSFDYGRYGGGAFKEVWNQKPKFKFIDMKIDGHAAEILSYQARGYYANLEERTSVMSVRFPKIGKEGRISLIMTTFCRSETDYSVAQKIFESIRFKND